MPWSIVKSRLKERNAKLSDAVQHARGESSKSFAERVVKFYGFLIKTHLIDPDSRAASEPFASEQAALERANSDKVIVKQLAKDLGLSVNTGPTNALKRGKLGTRSVLIVSHGGWIQTLMTHLITELGFSLETEPQPGFPKSTSIYRIAIYKRWLCEPKHKLPIPMSLNVESQSLSYTTAGGISTNTSTSSLAEAYSDSHINWQWAGKVVQMNDVSHLASLNSKVRKPPPTPVTLELQSASCSPTTATSAKAKSPKSSFIGLVASTIASGATLFSPSRTKFATKLSPKQSPTKLCSSAAQLAESQSNYIVASKGGSSASPTKKGWGKSFGFSFGFPSLSGSTVPRQTACKSPTKKRLTRRQRRQLKRLELERAILQPRKSLGW